MPIEWRTLELAGGRHLEFLLAGDPDGFPLVMHHGTPGDASTFADWDDACRAQGFRLICASRPGYGNSTRLAGRSVSDMAQDTAAILHSLQYDRFLAAGWSGGGPHALACAAVLGQQCAGAALLAGVGPSDAADLDFLHDMGQENLEEFGAAYAGHDALGDWMDANGNALRHVTGADIAHALGDLAPLVDQQALTGGYADQMAATFRRALQSGCEGWIDDDLAFIRPWGFETSDIAVPVTVWQGDLDRMVPFAHGQWLAAHIPHATPRMVAGQGHISLIVQYRREILDDLQSLLKRDRERL